MSDLDEALKSTGFSICKFGPDDDPCNKCGKTHKQLYYRRTCYEVNEGEYFCKECVMKAAKEIDEIIELTCPNCEETFHGYEHQKGDICFDCYADEVGMPT